METFVYVASTAWEYVIVLLGVLGTAVWALFYFILDPRRIALMTGSALSTLFMKFSTMRGMEQAINHRLLPMDPVSKDAKDYHENAVRRRVRIEEYLGLRRKKKADREGPYAVQQHIEDLYDVNFQIWQQKMLAYLVLFDAQEAVVRQPIYELDNLIEQIRRTHDKAILPLEEVFLEAKKVFSAALVKMGHRTSMGDLFRSVRYVWVCWRGLRRAYKPYRHALNERDEEVRRMSGEYRPQLEVEMFRLQKIEEDFLGQRIHMYQADWASSQLTAESGRTLDRLVEDNQKTHFIRRVLKLEGLPWDKIALRDQLLYELRGRVGLNPNTSLEDIFETWLRIYYLDLGPEGCPNVEPLGSRGFYMWIRQLVPPGAKGLAHAVYGHGPHHVGDTVQWIVPLDGMDPLPVVPDGYLFEPTAHQADRWDDRSS